MSNKPVLLSFHYMGENQPSSEAYVMANWSKAKAFARAHRVNFRATPSRGCKVVGVPRVFYTLAQSQAANGASTADIHMTMCLHGLQDEHGRAIARWATSDGKFDYFKAYLNTHVPVWG